MIRYSARWVLPISSAPIPGGVVAVADGRIVYVGGRDEAPRGDEYDLGDAVLMPGLVNAHTHLELTCMRGFLEELPFHEWIARLRASRNEVLDEQMMLDCARWGIVEGLAAGITTYADTCSSGVALAAMAEGGVRGIMYQEVFGPDPRRCEAAISGLRERLDSLRRLETPLVRLGLSPHAPYTVSDDLYASAARLAADEELPMAVHVAESDVESLYVVEGCGPFADALRARGIGVSRRARSPVDLLRLTGVLGPRTLLIHCVRVDERDLDLIADAGAPVAHCPVSNAKLGHGIAPVAEMLARGIAVGLGSDSMASNNRMDILQEARATLLLQRARAAHPGALTAERALELATLGGARALGLASRVGSLEAGKDADLCAFPLDVPIAYGDPASAVLFSILARRAIFVSVAGRVLVERSRVLAEDQRVRERVAASAEALARWHASPPVHS